MTNNEVRVKMLSPIILEGNKIKLDQLLLSFDKTPVIQKTNDLYHASHGFVVGVKSSGLFTVADNIDALSLPCHPEKPTSIDTRSGVWQTYKRKVRYHVIDELVFYAQADADYLESMLRNIGFLGTYTAIGFGEIADVCITQTPRDYSFAKDGVLMRSIPVGVDLDVDLGDSRLLASSFHQGLDDCYNNNNLVLSYTPN